MIGGFKRKELTRTTRIHKHPPMVEIFTRKQWLGFFELIKGYDVHVAREFSMSLIP